MRTVCHGGCQQLNFGFKIMALTIEEVRRIAALARLRLSPDEEGQLVSQLSRIVDYIDQLKSFPTAAAIEHKAGSAEAEDRVGECLPRAFFLANAPDTLDDFLVVPQVKGGEDA